MKFSQKKSRNLKQVSELILQGRLVISPTDTVFGILGSAFLPLGVEKIYKIKKRETNKPFIILISKMDDIFAFDIKLTKKQKIFLNKIWPASVSVILPCKSKKFYYLHRGQNSLAFRVPKNLNLQKLLKLTGPLVAPSANLAGKKPVQNVKEAKKVFKSEVALFLNGRTSTKPSSILDFTNLKPKIVRSGRNVLELKKVLNELNLE